MTGTKESEARGDALRPTPRRSLRPSTPDDAVAIGALLTAAGLRPNAEALHLHWKYWQEGPDWNGSRSYVLADGKQLLAHGAVIPATYLGQSGRLRMAHLIDWAARPTAAGAGLALMKQVGRLTEALYSIGGSDDTRRILPHVGFRNVGTVGGYVRPLSLSRLLRDADGRLWRRGPRMARSMIWMMRAPRPSLEGWSARRLAAEDVGRIAPVMPQPRRSLAVLERTEALFRYVLTCPILPMSLYELEYAGRLRGYFLLTLAPGQARLADAWIDSDDQGDWAALVGCIVREATGQGEAAELSAWASDPLLARALIDNGFHQRFSLPLMLRPGSQGMPEAVPRIQMLDTDAFYLHQGRVQLWA